MAGFRDKLSSVDPEEVKRRSLEFEKNQGATAPSTPEAEAIEGDVSDYIMPIKGMGRNILKAVVEKGVKEGAKVAGKEALKETAQKAEKGLFQIGKSVLNKQRAPSEGPDYVNENIAFRPPQKPKQVGWERFNFGKKPE